MSYIDNLGRVRGDKGYSFIPTIVEDTALSTTISWECTDDNVPQEEYPEDVVINKLFFIPNVLISLIPLIDSVVNDVNLS